ncbi:LOW QUALITY PROTEIN: hypothetical protein KUTeg_012696 [Tegillarca granosa]|uniref:Carboxylesterase type B domain-containing protein n=1 Tax=Tegillarca granosa TaxID=220873 RepID=A0ABQ9F2R2_TEGGR|nr:LOW QUALITY PROTEIN: hypothetical protein KUTeg_012696 [Tegillarca granosa]
MAGTTDGEASHFLTFFSYLDSIGVIHVNLTEGISKEFLCETFSQDMAKSYFNNSPKAAKALCDKYSYHGKEDKLVQQGILVADMGTDLFFIGPTVKTLKVHEDKNTERKTYHYFFSRAIPLMLGGIAPWFTKAGHATELAFLFGGSVFNLNLTTEESLLGDRMIEYWSNFAKTGNPNSASVLTWDEYGEDKNYIQLDLNITAKKDLFPDRMKLILEDIPLLISQPPSAQPPTSNIPKQTSTVIKQSTIISLRNNNLALREKILLASLRKPVLIVDSFKDFQKSQRYMNNKE